MNTSNCTLSRAHLLLPSALVMAMLLPSHAGATCMEKLRRAWTVRTDCSDLSGPLDAGSTLHFAGIWEVCCSAPPSPDAGSGPDLSCSPYPASTYSDPATSFKLVRLDGKGTETPVAGKVIQQKQCASGSAGLYRFDGKLLPGRYHLHYRNSTALELEVVQAADGGFLMDCLTDGAPPEEPDLAQRGGCSVGAATTAWPLLPMLLLLVWRRRR